LDLSAFARRHQLQRPQQNLPEAADVFGLARRNLWHRRLGVEAAA